jgi:hypothetical protein
VRGVVALKMTVLATCLPLFVSELKPYYGTVITT